MVLQSPLLNYKWSFFPPFLWPKCVGSPVMLFTLHEGTSSLVTGQDNMSATAFALPGIYCAFRLKDQISSVHLANFQSGDWRFRSHLRDQCSHARVMSVPSTQAQNFFKKGSKGFSLCNGTIVFCWSQQATCILDRVFIGSFSFK